MQKTISPSKIMGTVEIPSSKSYVHRILIAAALSNQPMLVRGNMQGDDINATISALTQLGANFQFSGDTILVTPIIKNESAMIDANESGSTLRFMLPIAAALGGNFTFTGRGRLADRPLGSLLNVIQSHGIQVDGAKLPLNISGNLKAGKYIINGNESSQYVTGLLFALPLLAGDSELNVLGEMVSESYVNITLDILKQFGIKIDKVSASNLSNTYLIKGGQKYISPEQLTAEGDWSSASFFAVLGAIGGSVKINGVNPTSCQGDKVVIDVVSKMGANIEIGKDSISVSNVTFISVKSNDKVRVEKLKPIRMSAKDCPDLVPAISVACAAANGTSVITNVDRLRDKECDRLEAVMDMLARLGIKTTYQNDSSVGGTLSIFGGEMTGAELVSYGDHRMVMSGAVAATIANGKSVVNGCEAVNKSYPKFFKDYVNVGGVIDD